MVALLYHSIKETFKLKKINTNENLTYINNYSPIELNSNTAKSYFTHIFFF